MAKYLKENSGKTEEVQPINTSVGAGDAGKMIQLDAEGLLNSNMMPSGVTAELSSITAAGALSQWNIVQIYNDAGSPKARKADAGTNNYEAMAFCPNAIGDAAVGDVQTDGHLTGAGMTPGSRQYLSETPGDWTETPVTGSGKIVQCIGHAASATKLIFHPEPSIKLV